MHRFFASGLVTLHILLLQIMTVKSLQAQETEQTNNDCTATISTVQEVITTGRDLQLSVNSYDISKDYPDYPANRPYGYMFVTRGPARNVIINSPQFMQSIATNIIHHCNFVSLVTFAPDFSDNLTSLGLMPDNSIGYFQCLDAGNNSQPVTWGYHICQ